jgi:hypothetical protein
VRVGEAQVGSRAPQSEQRALPEVETSSSSFPPAVIAGTRNGIDSGAGSVTV